MEGSQGRDVLNVGRREMKGMRRVRSCIFELVVFLTVAFEVEVLGLTKKRV